MRRIPYAEMDKASEQARQGNLAYFESLNSEQLIELVVKKDEDGRSLLHSAAVSGNLELLQLLASLGRGKTMVDVPDDEVRCSRLYVCVGRRHGIYVRV